MDVLGNVKSRQELHEDDYDGPEYKLKRHHGIAPQWNQCYLFSSTLMLMLMSCTGSSGLHLSSRRK